MGTSAFSGMMAEGLALRVEGASGALASQSPTARGDSGYSQGYAEAAALCVQMGTREFAADPDPMSALYEGAVISAEQSWTLQDGTKHVALGKVWLDGYMRGARCMAGDLRRYEDDTLAAARLLKAGVVL